MAIAYASSILTITGGTSGSRLTPANVINDATAFSTGSTYVVGAIMKYNAGGGLGTALYRCSTAVTVAGAYNPANWTILAVIQTKTLMIYSSTLDIGAFYNDTGWCYQFDGGLLRTANGCNWLSGSNYNSIAQEGFSANIASAGNMLNGGASGDVLTWSNVSVRHVSGAGAVGIGTFENANLGGSIAGITFNWGQNAIINAPGVNITNLKYLGVNLVVRPDAVSGVTHTGFVDPGQPENKIGVVTNAVTSTSVTGVSYIVASIGSSNLSNWQDIFNTLTQLPSVGDVLIATASRTIVGTGNFKKYTGFKGYAADFGVNNTRIIGIIGDNSFQFFEDLVVPVGFNFATQIKAYFGGTSCYFTRYVRITTKQGSNLLTGVKVRVVNTSNN